MAARAEIVTAPAWEARCSCTKATAGVRPACGTAGSGPSTTGSGSAQSSASPRLFFTVPIVINSAWSSAPGPWSMPQAPPAGDPIHPTGDAARVRPTGDGGPGHVAGRNGEENLYQSPT